MNPAGRGSGHGALWWDALASRMSEQRMALLVEVEEGAPTGGVPWVVTAYRFVALLRALRCIAIGHHAVTLLCGSCIRARSEWRQP